MPCLLPNYFVDTSHGDGDEALCKPLRPVWARGVTDVITGGGHLMSPGPARPSHPPLPAQTPANRAAAAAFASHTHSWPPRRVPAARSQSCSGDQEAGQGGAPLGRPPWPRPPPPPRFPGTLPAPRGHWQPLSPHEARQGVPALQKHREKHRPALPVPGVPAARVSRCPPPAGRRDAGVLRKGSWVTPSLACVRPEGQDPAPSPSP